MVSVRSGRLTRRHLLAGLGLGAAALGGGRVVPGCGSRIADLAGADLVGGEKPTLRVWHHQYGEPGTRQALERYAADYPDATIKVRWTPGDYPAKVSRGLRSADGPDVFEGEPDLAMVRDGQLVPLDDLIEPVRTDYPAAGLKSIMVDGKAYGVRIVDDTVLLYYRRSTLVEAGINPPVTMDELVSAAEELTTPDRKGLFVGNDAGVTPAYGGGSMLGPALWAAGQNYLTPDHKINFTGDHVVASFGKLKRLVEDKSILLDAPADHWDPSSFIRGRCAMQWTGLWAMPAIKKALGDDFGVVPFPPLSSTIGRPSVPQGGWAAMVSAKSGDIEAAKAFVKWLWIDNTAHQEDFNLSYGFHIPPRRSIAVKAAKLQDGPAAEAVRYYDEYAVAAGTTWTPAMNAALGDAATAIVRKGQDPDMALSAAAKSVQRQLDQLLG